MISFFVKKPITTLMFVSFFLVLGIVSFMNFRVEKNPKIDFPIVTVKVIYPGASPVELESSVINKIEDAVSELSEIEVIQSKAFDNFGYVFIEFNLESDVNIKFIEVKDKVEAILNDLPSGVEKPIIEKFDPLIEPVMSLVLSSDVHDGKFLYELADKKIKNILSGYSGVANIDIYGGKQRQINVFLNPQLMKTRYVDVRDILMNLRTNNKNIPGGVLEREYYSSNVQFSGEFDSVDSISNLEMVSRNGDRLLLNEVAVVEDGYKKVDSIARYNGKDVVALYIKKISDGNAIQISKAINKDLEKIKKTLPEGVSLEIASDNTSFIVNETDDAMWSIVIGIALTVIILFLFTGNFKSTFIASIVIPISIVSAFTLIEGSGFTINFLTLLAISTTLGTLIANAIVIIENSLEHISKGEDYDESVIAATKEVFVAVIASTGTNLVVFTPLAFMGDIIGKFMQSFGLTVIYLTIFSLIISFTLTPMLCAVFLKEKCKEFKCKQSVFSRCILWLPNQMDKAIISLKGWYKNIFELIFKFPKITFLLILCMLISLKFIMPYVGSAFVPNGDENKISISLQLPQGSTIARTTEVVKKVEEYIKDIPEVESYFSVIGNDGVENGNITLNLSSYEDRLRSDLDIIESMVEWISKIPAVEVNLTRGSKMGREDGDVSLYIYGDDFRHLLNLGNETRHKMEESGYFRSVMSSYKYPKNQISYYPNNGELIKSNITNLELGSVVRAFIYGDNSNVYKENGHEYDINVKLDDFYTESIEDIGQINVITKKGMTPVVELGRLSEDKAIPTILHRNKQRGIQIDGYLSKSTLGQVRKVIDDLFLELDLKDGYGYYYVGNAERQDSSGREISKAFLLAVIFTYMLLAAIMNSAIYPLSIVLSIFLSFIGVFYALFFFESTINIASMLGMVMLVGIVVNSSILLVDYALVKISEGIDVKDALWEAASKRFKAILMTSIAIIFGVLPQVWSIMPTKSSMGMVFLGGVLASVFFTFIFTPIAFWYSYRLKNFITKK